MRCGSTDAGETTAYGCRTDDGNYYNIYQFDTSKGRYLNLTADAASFSPLVALYDVDVNLLTFAGREGSTNAVIRNYVAPRSGTYYATVGAIERAELGRYLFTLQCTADPQGAGGDDGSCRPTATLSTGGQTFTGSLSSADERCGTAASYFDLFTFFTVPDEPVRITYSSSAFAPYIEVNTASEDRGVWRASDVPGEMTFTFYPETGGEHHIWVGSNTAARATGSYSIRVESLETAPCRRRAVQH